MATKRLSGRLTPGDRAQIDFFVDKYHVATPFDKIAADLMVVMRRTFAKAKRKGRLSGEDAYVRAMMRYAEKRHKANRLFARRVMTGRAAKNPAKERDIGTMTRAEEERVARLLSREIKRVFGFVPRAFRDQEGWLTWKLGHGSVGCPVLSIREIFYHGGYGSFPTPTGRPKLYLGYPFMESYRPRRSADRLGEKEIKKAVKIAKGLYDAEKCRPGPRRLTRSQRRYRAKRRKRR